jgi:hypothetical protein
MRKTLVWRAISVCVLVAIALGAYRAGQYVSDQRERLAGMGIAARFSLDSQSALTSSDPFKVEQALWSEIGEIDATRRYGIEAPYGAMSASFDYAKLSELSRAQHDDTRAARLLDEAVKACSQLRSPNCNREALLGIVRHLATSPQSQTSGEPPLATGGSWPTARLDSLTRTSQALRASAHRD